MHYVSVIAALDKNRVIGKDNQLPKWEAPGDLKRFRQLTEGKVVVMGRKTYESIGKPLPRRLNLIVSTTMSGDLPPTVYVAKDFQSAIHEAVNLGRRFNFGEEVMVIGGAQIYEQALPIADRLYLTLVEGEHEGDTFFPEIDEDKWKVISVETFPTHSFLTYERQ